MSDPSDADTPDLDIQLTVGELIAMLQRSDITNDATVVIDVSDTDLGGIDLHDWPDEMPAVDIAAVVGHSRPSKLIIKLG